jgi:hypothetical protein
LDSTWGSHVTHDTVNLFSAQSHGMDLASSEVGGRA